METNDDIQLHDLQTIEARLGAEPRDTEDTDASSQELESVSEFMIS